MDDKGIIGGVIILLLAIGAILFATSGPSSLTLNSGAGGTASAEVVAFAQCLEESGATFYGAFWCPHCKDQKALFGSAVSALPYVECSTPDGNGQLEVCKAKGVTSYPTWSFADGTVLTGLLQFATLAEKTGCTDPTPGLIPVSTASSSDEFSEAVTSLDIPE